MDEQFIPIDIHYSKLLDWLIDRRHSEAKWVGQLKLVQDKINTAIKGVADNEEISKVLETSRVNYFHCLKVLELLKVAEGDQKSLFGQYTSQRVKEWADIVNLYEKKNCYLADAAQQLIRNVQYEIPALKRQITKCQQQCQDCVKKTSELEAHAELIKEKFKQSCAELGIAGVNVKQELLGLVSELPDVYAKVIKMLDSIQPAISYYKSFVEFSCSCKSTNELLPMLCYLCNHGNVTLHQWKTGEIPQQSSITEAHEQPAASDGELAIDWGEGLMVAKKKGDDNLISEIDFGDIDFNTISLEGITTEDPAIEHHTESSSEDMETLLANVTSRNKLLDDLMELSGFLTQRITELRLDSDFPLAVQLEEDTLQVQSSQSIEGMLSTVNDVIGCITATKTQHLYMIKASPRYVDRLADNLTHQLTLSRRSTLQITALTSKREEAIETITNVEPQLKALVGETKQIQKQVSFCCVINLCQ